MRTNFQFDMTPWKVVICRVSQPDCTDESPLIMMQSMPQAPESGRVPPGADHVHIVAKYSGERDAREDEKWRALVRSTTRCEHGRIMRTRCNSCPGGIAPDRTGERLGTTMDRKPIIIPAFEDLDDIRAWTTSANPRVSDSV